MKMGVASVVVLLIVAAGLCSCGGGSSSSLSYFGTISYYSIAENGTTTSPWGDGSASQRPAMAVKFTPDHYPMTLTSVTIYPANNTGTAQMFNLYGFSDLSTETQIFSPVLNQSIPDTGTLRAGKTVNVPPTTIISGSFYIAVEWVTKPLTSASGANTFFLRTDSHLDYINTNYVRFSGTTWSSLESKNTTAGDLGIFANFGDIAADKKPVVVSTNPANGATGVDRNIQEIEIRFDKPMIAGGSVSGDPNWPLSNNTPARWTPDYRSFYISRESANTPLPAGTEIHITYNKTGGSQYFRDIFGNILDQYSLTFTTGQ